MSTLSVYLLFTYLFTFISKHIYLQYTNKYKEQSKDIWDAYTLLNLKSDTNAENELISNSAYC